MRLCLALAYTKRAPATLWRASLKDAEALPSTPTWKFLHNIL